MKKLLYILLLILIGLPIINLNILSFQEIIRLTILFVIIFVIYIFHLRSDYHINKRVINSYSVNKESVLKRLGIALVLTMIFLVTQFDPAFSEHNQVEHLSRNNLFFWVSISLIVLITIIKLRLIVYDAGSLWEGIKNVVSNLETYDKFVITIPLITIIGGIPIRHWLSSKPIDMEYYLTAMKIFGYILIWLVIRRETSFLIKSESDRDSFVAMLYKIRRLYHYLLIVLTIILINGFWRVGELYGMFNKLEKTLGEGVKSQSVNKIKFVLDHNKTLRIKSIEQACLIKMAGIYLKKDSTTQAQETIERLQKVLAGNDAVNRIKADVYFTAEKFNLAQGEYEEYLRRGFQDRESINNLGICNLKSRNIMGLIRLITEYKYLPENISVDREESILLGNSYLEAGRLEQAERWFNRALASAKEDSYILYKLGRIAYLQRDLVNAQVYFQKAIAADSSFADAHYRLGLCYETIGDSVAASGEYHKTINLLPNHYDALVKLNKLLTGNDTL